MIPARTVQVRPKSGATAVFHKYQDDSKCFQTRPTELEELHFSQSPQKETQDRNESQGWVVYTSPEKQIEAAAGSERGVNVQQGMQQPVSQELQVHAPVHAPAAQRPLSRGRLMSMFRRSSSPSRASACGRSTSRGAVFPPGSMDAMPSGSTAREDSVQVQGSLMDPGHAGGPPSPGSEDERVQKPNGSRNFFGRSTSVGRNSSRQFSGGEGGEADQRAGPKLKRGNSFTRMLKKGKSLLDTAVRGNGRTSEDGHILARFKGGQPEASTLHRPGRSMDEEQLPVTTRDQMQSEIGDLTARAFSRSYNRFASDDGGAIQKISVLTHDVHDSSAAAAIYAMGIPMENVISCSSASADAAAQPQYSRSRSISARGSGPNPEEPAGAPPHTLRPSSSVRALDHRLMDPGLSKGRSYDALPSFPADGPRLHHLQDRLKTRQSASNEGSSATHEERLETRQSAPYVEGPRLHQLQDRLRTRQSATNEEKSATHEERLKTRQSAPFVEGPRLHQLQDRLRSRQSTTSEEKSATHEERLKTRQSATHSENGAQCAEGSPHGTDEARLVPRPPVLPHPPATERSESSRGSISMFRHNSSRGRSSFPAAFTPVSIATASVGDVIAARAEPPLRGPRGIPLPPGPRVREGSWGGAGSILDRAPVSKRWSHAGDGSLGAANMEATPLDVVVGRQNHGLLNLPKNFVPDGYSDEEIEGPSLKLSCRRHTYTSGGD